MHLVGFVTKKFLGAILRNVFKQAGPQMASFQLYSGSNIEDDIVHHFNISGNFKAFLYNAGRINILLAFMWKTLMELCFDFPILPKHRLIRLLSIFRSLQLQST
jgi:hypothetical protein